MYTPSELPDTGGLPLNLMFGVGGLGGILWALYERFLRLGRDKADYRSETAEAKANEALFNMLATRLTQLETKVTTLEEELEDERRHGRKMELYIRKLEDWIKSSGMPLPECPPGVEECQVPSVS